MLRFRKVVCPVDFSESSRHALELAARVARRYDAELLALHVTPLVPTVFGFPPVAMADGPAVSEAVLSELKAEADAVAALHPAAPVLREGAAAFEILRFAEESEADLIVHGTHGRSGFERFVLGSVTEKVLRKAACPVLTVPPHADGEPGPAGFARIVCGVDFQAPAERALEHALSLAQEANGRVTLLHVVEWMPGKDLERYPQFDAAAYRRAVMREARERLEALVPEAARNWCEPDIRIACGKPYREILRVAADEAADLVVLGVHGSARAVDRLFFGSTAQHVVREAACPVLTVRA